MLHHNVTIRAAMSQPPPQQLPQSNHTPSYPPPTSTPCFSPFILPTPVRTGTKCDHTNHSSLQVNMPLCPHNLVNETFLGFHRRLTAVLLAELKLASTTNTINKDVIGVHVGAILSRLIPAKSSKLTFCQVWVSNKCWHFIQVGMVVSATQGGPVSLYRCNVCSMSCQV